MIIGAQGYTVRDYAKTEADVAETFKKLHNIGFKTLQVSAFGDIEPKRLRELADKNEIRIIITHTNPKEILNDTKAVIERHKIYGCTDVGIGSMPAEYHDGINGVRRFIADFTPAARLLHENGMKLHYHNHSFEFQKENGLIPFDVMVNETDSDLFGFILDTFWVQYGGRCPAQQIIALKDRITVCHFKDLKLVDGKHHTAAVMDGNICFPEVIEACEKANVRYAMIEQDETYGLNPFDELALSYKNLKSLGMEF